MFQNASAFNQSLSNLDTSKVTSMQSMFENASAFNNGDSPGHSNNPLNFNTSNVSSMSYMFESASVFNQSLSSFNTSNVTVLDRMFENASLFNQSLSNFDTSKVTTMQSMFGNALAFNNGGVPLTFDTSNVSNMSFMLYGTSSFNNGDLPGHSNNPLNFNTRKVTNMYYMLGNADVFNQSLSNFDTSNTSSMFGMLYGASAFNQDLSTFNISSLTDAGNMLTYSGVSNTNYDHLLVGWASQPSILIGVPLGAGTIQYTTLTAQAAHNKLINLYGWTITDGGYNPCFLKGTKILTNNGYIPIEDLQIGDLVKTLDHGFVPVHLISNSQIYNSDNKERIVNRLYKYSKDSCCELLGGLFEDLIITGGHSILIDHFSSDKQREDNEKIFRGITPKVEEKYRLLACNDENAITYEKEGNFTIYHLALENTNANAHYGIYANGLLVESCDINFLQSFIDDKTSR